MEPGRSIRQVRLVVSVFGGLLLPTTLKYLVIRHSSRLGASSTTVMHSPALSLNPF